jgi:hypothetical protein
MIAGAGNPTGSFTGPAEQLEYIGNHVYAYSGGIPIPNSNTNLLKFTTGSHYTKVEVLFSSRDSAGDDYRAFIDFNGQEVFGAFYSNTALAYPYGQEPVRLIIPAYTEVEIYMINVSTSSGYTWFALLTGRIYRG